MTTTLPGSSAVSSETAPIGRRTLLILSAGAAAAMLAGGNAALLPSARSGQSPRDFVRALSKTRWGWSVELAVLHRIDIDRPAALDILWAAIELDLDPTPRWHRKPALRLYDLYAAATDQDGREALASLVRSRSGTAALLARADRWMKSRSPAPRVWRTTGPDRQPIGILFGRA